MKVKTKIIKIRMKNKINSPVAYAQINDSLAENHDIHAFFYISTALISTARLKFAKKLAPSKHHA